MRWFTAALFLCLPGCLPAAAPLSAGERCSGEGAGRCDAEALRLLQCVNGTYVVYADCKGPKGCSLTSDTAECDTSTNGQGDRCAPTSEGKVRCDPDGGTNILRCVDGGLELEFACPVGLVCGFNDAGLTCI